MSALSWEKASIRASEALHALPCPCWRDKHDSELISHLIEDYLPFWFAEGPKPAAVANSAVRAQAMGLIVLLGRTSDGLGAAFRSMPPDPMGSATPTIGTMMSDLLRLCMACDKTEQPPTRRGRKANEDRYLGVAEVAARHYRLLTGKEPGRVNDRVDGKTKVSGAFPELLDGLFAAFGCAASADGYARRAAAKHKAWLKLFEADVHNPADGNNVV